MELLVKYILNGEFEEFKSYIIKFDLSKASPIYTIDQEPEKISKILKDFHNKKVTMTYRGISKIDSSHLFVIDLKKNLRNFKIEEIFEL